METTPSPPSHLPTRLRDVHDIPQLRPGGTNPPVQRTQLLGEDHETPGKTPATVKHSRTAPRALTCRRSRLWDSHATSSLTQDSEASKNLSVIFNSQGNRWICRSTNLLEKQLRSGTLPEQALAGCSPSPGEAKPCVVLRFGADKALGWWVTASHDMDAQSGAFCPLLAEQSSACARSRLSHLRGTTWE